MQARFSEYLDGRLNGREMQQISTHLRGCRNCTCEWESLRETQLALAALGSVSEPKDLLLRIKVAISQERARSKQSIFNAWNLAWKNTIGPFLLQASAGFASAVLLLGTVIVLVTMFTQPESAQATTDEPLGNPTAPRLLSLSSGAGNSSIGALAGPVVVEACVNDEGEVYDYRIVSGPNDEATRSEVENILLTSVFEPARFFGQPVRGLAVLAFSGVSVRG
ncbi:MAG TPA: zf-HC2 domain-containing protein [Terracidiphilus sp.]|nr:zf-HC2 domain-containing protein [Terracidiphilus sp.]